MNKNIKHFCYGLAILGMVSSSAAMAKEVEIKMLNHGSSGMFVFDPEVVHIAPGDSVHIVATDKGHNVEAVKSMVPAGAQAFEGQMNKDLTVKLDKPGIYGYECKPHYMMGMVGLIVVGKPSNEAQIKAAMNSAPNLAKIKFGKLLEQVGAGK